MVDNIWHGEIQVDLDNSKAVSEIRKLEKEFENLRGEVSKADFETEEFQKNWDHAGASFNKASNAIRKLDRAVEQNVEGLRDMGRQAQAAERQVRELYQAYAAAQMSAGKVPQNMTSWLPKSGVSQQDKDLIAGSANALGGNVVGAINAETAARDKSYASLTREIDARKKLLQTASDRSSFQRDIDQYGQLEATRKQHVKATLAESAAQSNLNRVMAESGENTEQAAQAAGRLTSATQNRLRWTDELRVAQERHGADVVRSMDEQEKREARLAATREKNQAGLRTAQGRLQVEEEAAAYRRLEETVGRAEAAKRRLAMAQRQVNAAQESLRAATGDIVAQTAATNRLADAKRRLAQAEVANRSAQQPVGNMDSTRYALYDVGATAGAAAIAGGIVLGATIKNYAELDAAFATVSRTSGETGHNLDVMSSKLLDMGSRIPVPLQGLTDMAARAAQLGVEGQKNILDFTETMSKFAAVSDTVTETEVAEYFGRLNNLTGNMGNWEEMADAVASVGISGASTDQQILKTAQEIAQAGAGANYSQKEIIGLAGAFASLAVPPERARSVLLDLNKIMTKGMGESTESMKLLSNQMGISEDAIRGMWRAKPTDLIQGMAKSLKDMEPEEVMTFLSDFGLKGARALPVFMAFAKDAKAAGDGMSVFATNMNAAEDSTGELDRQFSITMETLTAAWQTFLNSLQAGGFDLMSDIGPVIADVLNNAGDLLDWAREFINTPIGGFIGSTTLALAGLATAIAGVVTLAAIGGASLLAIKSAASSGLLGAGAARVIGNLGNSSKLAGQGLVVMGNGAKASAPHLSTLGANATKTDKAMAGLKRAGAGVAGVLGGPIGIALAAATAIGILGANAVQTAQSYRDLGAAITAVDAETGKSMSSDGILSAANANVLKNSDLKQWSVNLANLLPGEDLAEIDTKAYTDYLKLVREGNEVQKQAQKAKANSQNAGAGKGVYGTNSGLGGNGGFGQTGVTGQDYAANQLGQIQADRLKETGTEIGTALSKLSTAEASVAFNQLWKDADKAGLSMDELVTSLGGDFSNAFYGAADAAGAVKNELGGVNVNGDIGNFMLKEYASTAQGTKDAITEMNPALEEMEEGLQGVFAGMSEGAQAMTGYFSAMIGGAQSLDQMKAAFVELGVANGETGELMKGQVDLYDEATGKWTLITAEQQAAVGSLSAYAGAQVAAIQGEYAMQSAILDKDVALANAQTKMDESRSTFLEYADTLGIGAEEAKRMADSLGLIEGQYLVMIDTSSATTAAQEVQLVLDKVNAVPGAKQIMMTALTEDAKAQLEALGFTVEEVDGTYTVTITDAGTAAATESAINQIPTDDETKTITVEMTGADLVIADLERIAGAQQGVGTVLKTDAQTSTYYPGNSNFSADGGLAGSSRKFANGRYTGAGGKWTPAGVVHRGEYVFPKREVSQTSGVPTLDSLGRMIHQNYPQAFAPNVVVQGGGGQNGPVSLDMVSIQALASAVRTQINLDGAPLANSVNGANRTNSRKSSN